MKRLSYVLLICLLIIQLLPMTAFAEDVSVEMPNKPMEKTLDSQGNWYKGYFEGFEGEKTFAPVYFGRLDANDVEIIFETREDAVLSSVFLGIGDGVTPNDLADIKLVDWRGYEIAGLQVDIQDHMYIFRPSSDVFLEKGSYKIVYDQPMGLTGDFIVSGMNYDAFIEYQEKLSELNEKESENLGDELSEDDVMTQTPSVMKPMVFVLDEDSIIDEVIVNTNNGGLGAPAGEIAIADETGSLIYVSKADASPLGDVDNGMWTAMPKMIFPAGVYQVLVSDMNVLSYTPQGEPYYYVKVSEPYITRHDFTGTYKLDLDAVKTRTIMGPVNETQSSFSLRDFEVTIIDKGPTMEAIAVYEDIPFSQELIVVEAGVDYVVCEYSFDMDLTGLPYSAAIGSAGQVTFAKYQGQDAQIAVDSGAYYKRAESAEKGEDDNVYKVTGKASFVSESLPPFVMTALGKVGGVGNIPGADNPLQNGTGLLFPPLVGALGQVISETIKRRDAEEKKRREEEKAKRAKSRIRNKDWYKKQYPGASDQEIAMIMLADAMGATDNPDEGDAISVGDNEVVSSGPTEETSAYEDSGDYEDEDPWAEDRKKVEEDIAKEEAEYEEKLKQEQEDSKREEEGSNEPEPEVDIPVDEWEYKEIQTSANGATGIAVKNPKTGQWEDYETGNPIDMQDYEDRVVKEMADNKAFNDAEFEKNTKGITAQDKINRAEMKRIKQEYEKNEQLRKLVKKHGGDMDDLDALRDKIEAKQAVEQERFEKWQMIGDIAGAAETGATVVQVGADAGVDVLSNVVPGGKAIKNVYKVTKNVAGTMADKGVNTGSFTQGLVLGAADVGCDYIDNPIVKATVVVASETAAPAVGAAIRGEDVSKEAAGGFFNGVVKATVGAVSDKVIGSPPDIDFGSASKSMMSGLKAVVNSGEGSGKVVSGLVNEFGVKPALDSTGKRFADYFE